MDDRRFDSLITTLATGGSRRGVLHTLGGSALAAVAARLGLADDAEAKKKSKNKKKNKKKCKKACCKPGQECVGGACEDAIQRCQNDADCDAGEVCAEDGVCVIASECSFSDQCAANEICVAGQCIVCAFLNKPCGEGCCSSNEACVDGLCVVGQGTCPAGGSICDNDSEDACNEDNSCFCGQRNDNDEVRCIGGFLNDSRDNCTCINDFQCERDFGAGAICIKGGPGCQCKDADLGRCARLCPTQTGN